MKHNFNFDRQTLAQLREISHREGHGYGRKNKLTPGGVGYSNTYDFSIFSEVDGIPFVLAATLSHAVYRSTARLGFSDLRDLLGLISDTIQDSPPLQQFILNDAEEHEVCINFREYCLCFFGSVESDCLRIDTVLATSGETVVYSDPRDLRADLVNNQQLLLGKSAVIFKDKVDKHRMNPDASL